MLDILIIVLPVFLLIGAGYAAVRLALFADSGIDGLIAFVVRFATPSLLFVAMLELDLAAAFEPRMLVAYYAGALLCFALALVAARAGGQRPGVAVAIAFSSYFSNTVLVGLPIMLRAYGEAKTEPVFGIIALHAPMLLALGMIAMEVSRQDGAGALAALRRAGRSIVRNALMIGIGAGLALNLAGLAPPEPVLASLRLLADATLPTALFALGAALTRYTLQAEIGWAFAASALKLVVHPAAAYLIAGPILGLPPLFLNAAVIIAAMPAGINAYVFATMYQRAEPIAAGAVLLSTALSVVTISAWLAVLGGAG